MLNRQQIFTLENGRVKVKGAYVGLSKESTKKLLLEQGFTIDEEDIKCIDLKGNIDSLGVCNLRIWWGNNSIGRIVITTDKEYTEEEMMAILEQVKEELPDWPRYDYNGWGVSPKPHEIDYFWDLAEGLVKIVWDGYNIKPFSHNKDGIDKISFEIWGPIVKDEAYWRSEVD